MQPLVLQMCSLVPVVQRRLEAAFAVVRLPERGAADSEWMDRHAKHIQAVVTGGDLGLDTALAEKLPNLRIIAIHGVGYDRVDLAAAWLRGIKVSNTPDVLTDDVADLAVGLMIDVLRRLVRADRFVRSGSWKAGPFMLGRRVSGARYGIVGLGRIGQALARRLAGFGGTISYTARTQKNVAYEFFPDACSLAAAVDVLFITLAASPSSKNLVNAKVLDALGEHGVLINIARGSVVDEPTLARALIDGRIGGAGLDVFQKEPDVPDELLNLPNVVLSPHIGSATAEARTAMGNLLMDNLEALFSGCRLPSEVVPTITAA